MFWESNIWQMYMCHACHVCHDVCGECGEDLQVGHDVRGGRRRHSKNDAFFLLSTWIDCLFWGGGVFIRCDCNDPTASFPSLLAWVKFICSQNFLSLPRARALSLLCPRALMHVYIHTHTHTRTHTHTHNKNKNSSSTVGVLGLLLYLMWICGTEMIYFLNVVRNSCRLKILTPPTPKRVERARWRKNTFFSTSWFVVWTFIFHELVCLFLISNHAHASAHAQHVLVLVVSRLSIGNYFGQHSRNK